MAKKNNPNYPKVENILRDIGEPNKSQPILDKVHKTIEVEENKNLDNNLTDEDKEKLKNYDSMKKKLIIISEALKEIAKTEILVKDI